MAGSKGSTLEGLAWLELLAEKRSIAACQCTTHTVTQQHLGIEEMEPAANSS